MRMGQYSVKNLFKHESILEKVKLRDEMITDSCIIVLD